VFVAAIAEKVIGRALEMPIPQYAYFNDRGRRIQVVVVQAEEARGKPIVGARALDGTPVVGFISDFELLGNARPERWARQLPHAADGPARPRLIRRG
jgi:hypothetical protein